MVKRLFNFFLTRESLYIHVTKLKLKFLRKKNQILLMIEKAVTPFSPKSTIKPGTVSRLIFRGLSQEVHLVNISHTQNFHR